MSEPASISTGIAGRYASAVFSIAKEDKALAGLQSDIAALEGALADSADFRTLITSPLFTRDQQQAAIGALADKMGLGATMANTLRLMASKRRLFVLPQLAAALRRLIAAENGEVTAEVTAAAELSAAQQKSLAQALKKAVGKDVKIKLAVDAKLIGGLVVKVGSQMIDTSIRARLNALQNKMKEV